MQSTNQHSLDHPSLVLTQSSTLPQHTVRAQDLPSTTYQFSRWFELDTKDFTSSHSAQENGAPLMGSTLHSPRIREGPANVVSLYASHSIMYCKKSQDWKDYRNMAEDWEHTEEVNLSYQDLGDDYQLRNLNRCLNRLVICTHLQLMDNSLSHLKNVTLPNCIHLNVSRNRFTSFRNLPKAPQLEHLSLAENAISSLKSFSSLSHKYPRLKTLVLKGNPVADHCEYRQRGFQALPRLELLDGYPNLPSDNDLLSSNSSTSCSSTMSMKSKCTIS